MLTVKIHPGIPKDGTPNSYVEFGFPYFGIQCVFDRIPNSFYQYIDSVFRNSVFRLSGG